MLFIYQNEHARRFSARARASDEADDEHEGADGKQHVEGQVVVLVLLHHRDVDAWIQDQPCGQRQNRQTSQLHTHEKAKHMKTAVRPSLLKGKADGRD